MGKMSDLALEIFPDGLPGWKEPTTSRDAAKAMRGRSETLREAVLDLLGHCVAGLTPDEAAGLLNETVLAIRPRFSELSKAGLIVPTGSRRKNESGLAAKVWEIPPR